MSVINQMLKDLDKRAPESVEGHELPNTVTKKIATKKPSLKFILISIFILGIINVVGIYIWQLSTENQQLKNKQSIIIKTPSNIVVASSTQQVESSHKVQEIESQPSAISAKLLSTKIVNNNITTSILATKERLKAVNKPLVNNPKNTESYRQKADSTTLTQINSKTKLQPNIKLNIKPIAIPETKKFPEATILPKATMTVSRRQLTSKELIAQKLDKAEKALSINQIAKAEALFEDVLIIEPTHLMARKKLAALWFGRKSSGAALNLLSQGLSITPNSNELRMMKAKIYSKQGYWPLAYKTLMPMALFEQEEYQIFLANVAQQAQEYKAAINAYQLLIKIQPDISRWYLGLGIVYDKDSQFLLAVEAYNQALTRGDLSHSSMKFAQQRKQALALGE